jgi:hypothetical protein
MPSHSACLLSLIFAGSALSAADNGAATMPEPGAAVANGAVTAAPTPWTPADSARWRARVVAAGGVAPAPAREVSGEKTRISPKKPAAWGSATKLKELKHLSPGALDPASVVIHHGAELCTVALVDSPQAATCDVLLDGVWGGLGLGPSGKLKPEDEVSIDYRVSQRRVDALVRAADGSEHIRVGEPAQLIPALPEAAAGETLLARIFVDYRQDSSTAEVLPLLEAASAAPFTTGSETLPKTVAKLRAGQPVSIVCWGDSVTEGGDLEPHQRHGDVLGVRLAQLNPQAVVQTIAVGGSNSRQWLLAEFPGAGPHPSRQKDCDFARVLAAKPDLVVIEFVNDQWMSRADAEKHYRFLVAKLHAAGSEVLLLTPQRNWERDGSIRAVDGRGLVAAYRAVGHDGVGVGVADMAGRWEHLWREAIPFPALLANGFNHPDARGHRLFYEEVCRALGVTP